MCCAVRQIIKCLQKAAKFHISESCRPGSGHVSIRIVNANGISLSLNALAQLVLLATSAACNECRMQRTSLLHFTVIMKLVDVTFGSHIADILKGPFNPKHPTLNSFVEVNFIKQLATF